MRNSTRTVQKSDEKIFDSWYRNFPNGSSDEHKDIDAKSIEDSYKVFEAIVGEKTFQTQNPISSHIEIILRLQFASLKTPSKIAL